MEWVLALISSMFRVSTPLLFASMGGLMSERSGVVNIALEGLMLIGAMMGAVVTYETGSPWLGFLAAGFAGTMLAILYAIFVIDCGSDQIVAGTAINMLAAGFCPLFLNAFYQTTGSPPIPLESRFSWFLPGVAWVFVLVVWVGMRFSALGLWIQFAGEHPEALETAGIRVRRVRYVSVAMGGFLAGLGGASLSLFLSSSFTRNMTAGRGFMALAALILGKWKPIPTALACLFIGLMDALQIRLQGTSFPGGLQVPVQFIQILPYIVTVLVLAGFVGKSRAPRSLGVPFEKS